MTKDKGQLTMLVETGLPVSFELLGTGFDLLVEKYKTRRASSVSGENKLTVPVPFVMEPILGLIACLKVSLKPK
ncbi:hypothetical protein [Clostridium senegalense]|uniref:Uncharacterized protein n=1 Tax=Clostridium senegalense TaxID=1465809 RepID=A0A6M0H5F2_9CLOT|nr:hypothetical protein [Clostridium senegalense]NEU05538.1 hypothetical protein [Clostridium senegalense]